MNQIGRIYAEETVGDNNSLMYVNNQHKMWNSKGTFHWNGYHSMVQNPVNVLLLHWYDCTIANIPNTIQSRKRTMHIVFCFRKQQRRETKDTNHMEYGTADVGRLAKYLKLWNFNDFIAVFYALLTLIASVHPIVCQTHL